MFTRLFVIAAIAVAYFGFSLLFRKRQLSTFVGMEYLILGFLLASLPIDHAALKPLVYPFLGWIGMLIGLQVEFRFLKNLPRSFLARVALFVLTLSGAIAGVLIVSGEEHRVAAVIGLALTAISFRTVSHFVRAKGTKNRFVLFFVSVIPFFLLSIFTGLHVAFLSPDRVILLAGFVLVFPLLSIAILAVESQPHSIILFLTGIIVLASEGCAVFGISPLVVGFFTGVILINKSSLSHRLYRDVAAHEKPLYMLFLLLTGMLSGIPANPELLFQILMVVLVAGLLRYAFFRIGLFGLNQHHWAYFMAPGGLAVAIGVDFWMRHPVGAEDWLPAFLVATMILQFMRVLAVKTGEPL